MRQIEEPGLCPEYNAGGGQEEFSRLWMKPGEWIGRTIIKHERGVCHCGGQGSGAWESVVLVLVGVGKRTDGRDT